MSRTEDGFDFDIALAGMAFEENMIARSSLFPFLPGKELRTCSAEDLIVTKSFADRERDWLDVEGVIIRQNQTLDWTIILKELTPLCQLKKAPEIITRLKKLRNTHIK